LIAGYATTIRGKEWSMNQKDKATATNPIKDAPSVLTIEETAKELRCSKAHVYNVIAGKVMGVSPLPAIIMGRRKLVRRSALEQWKHDNETCATISPLAIDTVRRMEVRHA